MGGVFEHLCQVTPVRPDDIAGPQPLYQSVDHGCLAEQEQEECVEVYRDRILCGDES